MVKTKKTDDKKISKKRFLIFALIILTFFTVIFAIYAPRNGKVEYGVTFSKPFAEYLDLDWKKSYIAILDDLEVKLLRIPAYWSETEPQKDSFVFEDIDWQIEQAKERNAKIILVLGQKQPRWPECHIPEWAQDINKKDRESQLLEAIKYTVNRYKDEDTITAWQIENEPFLPYGECPEFDKDFLDLEIELVKNLDPDRPIVITDSGELSTWYSAASRADIFGTTLYRIIWNQNLGYVRYPISSLFYRLKAAAIHYITDVDKIIIVELQGEPWTPETIKESSLEEQYKSMSKEQFRKNIDYVKEVEFSEAYLWGAEWWYWLKTQKGDDALWEEAKKIF